MKKGCKYNYKLIILFVISLIFLINFISAADVQISTCTDLQNIRNDVSGNYILMNNIDCSATTTWNGGAGFIPIGNLSRQFNGTFNGNNYTISNLYINREDEIFVALFGGANNYNIMNVGLLNVNIKGLQYTGGLIGNGVGGSISNSYVTGNVDGYWDFIDYGYATGGLIGESWGGNTSNSYSTATVTGFDYVGGLVGAVLNGGNILNSYSTGNVNGEERVGGLVGDFDFGGLISNSYSTGNVNGYWVVGGLTAINWGNISNSFTTGNVNGNGNRYTGGLVGSNIGTISNSYWNDYPGVPNYCWANDTGNYNINCTAINNNISYFKGDVYPNRQPFIPWPFFSIWQERANDYPSLTWQNLGGDISPSGGGNPGVQIQISTCQQLQDMRNNMSGDYVLMDNINCSATSGWNGGLGFRPVGNETNPFTGTFNGNNYNITNLYINRPTENHIGLFGWVDGSNSNIMNVGLTNININGNTNVGALVGYLVNSNISNSYSTGDISGNGNVGGLVGWSMDNISNCYSTVNVVGSSNVGGLVGLAKDHNILNSYAAGNVVGSISVGGLIGQADGGYVHPSNPPYVIYNSFATGYVTGSSIIGGLIGEKKPNIDLIDSYWNNHSGNPDHCWANDTRWFDLNCTAIQNNASYFQDDVYPLRQPFTQWDFISVWGEKTNDYPILKWQNLGGSVTCVSDSSCGVEGFVGSKFCINGNVFQNSTDYTCSNPGTPSSSCISSTVSVLNQTCEATEICSNGVCINITGGICSNYTRCEDYLNNQTACEQDTCFNKTSVNLGGAEFSCANINFIPNSKRAEKCIWDEGACKLKINNTIDGSNISASKDYAHTCNEIQSPGECVDGRMIVNLSKEIIWDPSFQSDVADIYDIPFEDFINDTTNNPGCQDMVESCTSLSALVICNDNLSGAKVPFFGFTQFVISIFVIGIVYFIILFRKNSKLKNNKTKIHKHYTKNKRKQNDK